MGTENSKIETITITFLWKIPPDYTGKVIYLGGVEPIILYYRNRYLHREDGPAIVYLKSNDKFWYLNGFQVGPMDVFDQLSDEQKEKAIWTFNEWR